MRARPSASLLAALATLGLAACGSSTAKQSASTQAACPPAATATTTTSTTGGGAPQARAAAELVISTGNASGNCPTAKAAGTIVKPVSITLRGTAEPPQGADVKWKFTCETDKGGQRISSGEASLTLPGGDTPPLPVHPAQKCLAAVTGQLDGSGKISISLVTPHEKSG